MNLSKCPICNSMEIKIVFPEAADHITRDVFRVLGCKTCEVCFTDPVPDNLENYYPSQYRKYGPLTLALLQGFYRLRVKKWVKSRKIPGKALEIGCGPGLMLDALRQQAWEVMGLERTEAMASYARDTLGLNVLACGLEDLVKTPTFDMIIMFNVLEHVQDPLSILKECAARLKPGGALILNVPNFQSWQARFSGPMWLHLDPPRHLYHFTPNALANVLRRADLKFYDISFVSPEHDPYGWIESIINRLTGSYNSLTRFLMGLERFNAQVFVSMILSVLFLFPALFLSATSWLMKNGALMEVIAVSEEQN